jgi:hypothetical protein
VFHVASPLQGTEVQPHKERFVIRTTAVLLAAAASITFAASPAAAAPAAGKDLCKSGGYASYVDPATGAPFNNQGQCVSFANGGGVLVHELTASVVFDRLLADGPNPEFGWHPVVQGATPGGLVLMTVYVDGAAPRTYGPDDFAIAYPVPDETGEWIGFDVGADCLPERTFTVTDVATGRTTAPVDITDVPVC